MSNNLDLSQVATNQSNKETTINDQAAQIDAALTERLAVNTTSANVSLTDSQFRRYMLFDCSGHTVARTLTIPAIKRSLFIVKNSGTATLSVVRGTTSISVLAGAVSVFATDGTTNVLEEISTSLKAEFYDIGFFAAGTMEDSELLLNYIAVREFTLPASLTGSQAVAVTGPAGAATLTIKKDGASIGTVNFASAATTGTFTFASASTFSAGSVLSVVGQETADTSLADVSVSFKGTR